MQALIVWTVVIGLYVAAVLWGHDSRDGPESLEWVRRRAWYDRHGPFG